MSNSQASSRRGLLIGLFVAALLVAGVLSYYASSSPDGLEKVAGDKGFDSQVKPHDIGEDSPLADYGVAGVENERASVGLAGIAGVVLTAGIAGGLFFLVRPKHKPASATSTSIDT